CAGGGGAEPFARAPRKLVVADADRTQLLPVAKGLLEVVAEDLVELARPLARGALQPAGIALVQLRASLFWDAEVCGVTDENVPEPKAVLLREDRAAGLDELLSRQRHQAGAGQFALVLGCELGDRTAPELLAYHGGPLDHCSLLGLEAVDAGGQQRAARGLHREVRRG